MIPSPKRSNQKYGVRLQAEQRQRLCEPTRNGHAPAKKFPHARALPPADESHPDGRRPDRYITGAIGPGVRTPNRIRRRFAPDGEGPALGRRPRRAPPIPPKLDADAEAPLVALAAPTRPRAAPAGPRACWPAS